MTILDADLAALVRAEVEGAIRGVVAEPLVELRRFVDRRFAELSAEIHASATMAEMTEAALGEQIGRVQQEIARVLARPLADSRASGLELEAVVHGTEDAANQILEAAEAILEYSEKGGPGAAGEIGRRVQAIFEACSFQDLTSQRVNRAIHHLQEVDQMLGKIAFSEGAELPPAPPPPGPGGSGANLAQDVIDKLMEF
jgi:hypothetical protein